MCLYCLTQKGKNHLNYKSWQAGSAYASILTMGVFQTSVDFFGLDIGSSAIRLVELKHHGGNPVLVTMGEVAVEGNITTSDSTNDRPKVSALVRKLVQDSGVSTKNVVASLPSAKVFASVISTPNLSDSELDSAVRYQADEYIPMALDQVKLDWARVGEGATADHVEVLLVAAPNTITDRYTAILEGAGLEILALETDGVALSRAMVKPASLPVLILDFGSSNTSIIIVAGGTPRLIRSVPVGGNVLCRVVAQALGLDDTQAQQFVYKFGLTQSKLEGEVLKSLKPSVDSLIADVSKSITFFAERSPQSKLEKIVLTGGSSKLPELPTYLANAVGLPVEIGNPWQNVSYPAKLQDQLAAGAASYAVAAGLGLRGMQ